MFAEDNSPNKKRRAELSPGTPQRSGPRGGELPDVRLEKVLAAREALRRHRYYGEHVLDETLRRLRDDLGIPCRRESGVDASEATVHNPGTPSEARYRAGSKARGG